MERSLVSPEFVKKLAQWRNRHKERWAKALLSSPIQTTMRRIVRPEGVLLIMGSRRSGKTGLAMEIMDDFHDRKNIPGAVCYPQEHKKLKKLLPRWVKVVTRLKDLPPNSICVVDEASQVAHARRTSSGTAVDLDALVAISEQKHQLIIFITHHSRKFDINDVHGSDMIIWKMPTLADTMWEREELQMYVLRAWEFFEALPHARESGKFSLQQLKACYVMNLKRMEFYTFKNGLPKWWTNELSTVFKLFEDLDPNGKGAVKAKEVEAKVVKRKKKSRKKEAKKKR